MTDIKEFDVKTHGCSFSKWHLLSKFNDSLSIQSTSQDKCPDCAQYKLKPQACGKHPVKITTNKGTPITGELSFNRDKKNKSIFWFVKKGVKFADQKGSNVYLDDYIVNGILSVTETPQFGAPDKYNIVAKIKIKKCNSMLIAFFNELMSEKTLESLGIDYNNGLVFDNSISDDGIMYCRPRYINNALLSIYDGAELKHKMSLIKDYCAVGGLHSESLKAKKFVPIHNLVCRMSLTPDLISVGNKQFLVGSKPKTFTVIKVGFTLNWVSCQSTIMTTSIDENGDEIEVQTASLSMPDQKKSFITEDDDEDDVDIEKIISSSSKKEKGSDRSDKPNKTKPNKTRLLFEEESISESSSSEEEEVEVKKSKHSTKGRPGKPSRRPKKPETESEEEESEEEEEVVVKPDKSSKKSKKQNDQQFFDTSDTEVKRHKKHSRK